MKIVAYGERGYLGFKPGLRTDYGTLNKYSNWDGLLSSQSAYGVTALKLSSGEADGEYLFVHL
ncbi:hypothetical protein ACQCT6_18165 [Cytobacillus gottheilii]|uniref:hypothetical protein n=1 Tax=Cytobacillus gottheilii TaxID=859144 RepID=UPI003CF1C39B